MKTTFIFVLLFFTNLLNAQEYQNICSPGVTMFRDDSGTLKGFRYDTLQITGNNDSVFLTFFTIHIVPGQSWVDTAGGTILGRKIIRKHDGWFIFFNQNSDTIRINTQARQNNTWKLMELPDKQYIRAKINSVSIDSIIGLADSIKTISLQAFDSLDNPIQYPSNNLLFKLSKHYGLTQTCDFWIFPSISPTYTLAGKTNPKVGVQPLSMRDVYDFNVGDEFHYYYYGIGLHASRLFQHYIWYILAKTMAADSSTVTYKIRQCLHETSYQGSIHIYDTIDSQDTLSVTYNFPELETQYWFNMLPDEFKCIRQGWYRYANHYEEAIVSYSGNYKVQRKIRMDAYVCGSETNYLWEPWDTVPPDPYSDNDKRVCFASGLGETSSTNINWLGLTDDQNLVYYKKGSETWGTPVAKDCSSLLGKEELTKSDIHLIQIMPNPVDNQAKIYFSDFLQNDNSHVVIYDCLGKEVFNEIIHSNPFIFNRRGISNGIYILNYIDNYGNQKGKLRIILQ